MMFQHTAARRRLGPNPYFSMFSRSFNTQPPEGGWLGSFTYRRPRECFNTQPPEGGWVTIAKCNGNPLEFQHTAARRRLVKVDVKSDIELLFQHTAARRRLDIPTKLPPCSA